MGRWVTLDDDQHVYISDGGKVLATRGAISSAAGGKERGQALAARSKAAVGKATDRTARAIEHARAAAAGRPSLREQAAAARAAKGTAEERAGGVLAKIRYRRDIEEETGTQYRIDEMTRSAAREGLSAGQKADLESQVKQQEKRLAAIRAPRQAKINVLMKRAARVKAAAGIKW